MTSFYSTFTGSHSRYENAGNIFTGDGNVMCVFLYQRVCVKFTEPKVCTVGYKAKFSCKEYNLIKVYNKL